MGFTLLAGNALKVAHVCRAERRSVDGQVVDTSRFAASLVILDENHQVLDVLELDETKQNDVAVQVFWLQTK